MLIKKFLFPFIACFYLFRVSPLFLQFVYRLHRCHKFIRFEGNSVHTKKCIQKKKYIVHNLLTAQTVHMDMEREVPAGSNELVHSRSSPFITFFRAHIAHISFIDLLAKQKCKHPFLCCAIR